MIKFFRRIRFQLLDENKLIKYLLYAMGEIALVVIGILIALQINNWNENQKDLRNEIQLLEAIQSNLKEDEKNLESTLERYSSSLENITRIFQDRPIPDDSLIYIYTRATGHAAFIPITTAFDRSMSSGKFDLIRHDSLAGSIQYLYAFTYKSGEDAVGYLDRVTNDITRLLVEEKLDMYGGGIEKIEIVEYNVGVTIFED